MSNSLFSIFFLRLIKGTLTDSESLGISSVVGLQCTYFKYRLQTECDFLYKWTGSTITHEFNNMFSVLRLLSPESTTPN